MLQIFIHSIVVHLVFYEFFFLAAGLNRSLKIYTDTMTTFQRSKTLLCFRANFHQAHIAFGVAESVSAVGGEALAALHKTSTIQRLLAHATHVNKLSAWCNLSLMSINIFSHFVMEIIINNK